LHGFINILKPPGMTSHDVVVFVRKIYRNSRVGHGGTLDPGAAGVLPIMVGKATRLSSILLDYPKVYRAELKLGTVTDTDDCSGRVLSQKDVPALKLEDIEAVLDRFRGNIRQLPPMVSAVKVKGKKLYQYARQGAVVERKPREVKIYSLNVVKYVPPERVLLEADCSKGTYMRVLCAQIGEELRCGGHMSFLLRKKAGRFELPEAYTLEEVDYYRRNLRLNEILLPVDYVLADMDKLLLGKHSVKRLCQGGHLSLEAVLQETGDTIPGPVDGKLVPVYTTKKEFVALARWKSVGKSVFLLKPEKVFKSI